MDEIRLKFTDAEIKDGKIVISKCDIVKSKNGEHIKTADINNNLLELIKRTEIIMDDYSTFIRFCEKNDRFVKLCEEFQLYK